MATIWDVLGIEPTKNEDEIRRAYARELKRRRPEGDLLRFQELREAFDSAKDYANAEEADEFVNGEAPPFVEAAVIFTADNVGQLAPEAESTWSREELEQQAERFAGLLTADVSIGPEALYHYLENELPDALEALRHYLENELPDALAAKRAFSLALAMALNQQPGLRQRQVQHISDVMDWDIDSYGNTQLPGWLVEELVAKADNIDQQDFWQWLARHYEGSRMGRLKWRLLTQAGAQIPWWARIIPDFIPNLSQRVEEICARFPDLRARFNPALLEAFSRSSFGLSWEMLITLFVWVYVAFFISSGMPPGQSIIMLLIVGGYLWLYPALERHFAPGSRARNRLYSVVWGASVAVIALALYLIIWQASTQWGQNAVLKHVPVIIVPAVVVSVWMQRSNWRTLPISIVLGVILFPGRFICALPLWLNMLGLIMLLAFYMAM